MALLRTLHFEYMNASFQSFQLLLYLSLPVFLRFAIGQATCHVSAFPDVTSQAQRTGLCVHLNCKSRLNRALTGEDAARGTRKGRVVVFDMTVTISPRKKKRRMPPPPPPALHASSASVSSAASETCASLSCEDALHDFYLVDAFFEHHARIIQRAFRTRRASAIPVIRCGTPREVTSVDLAKGGQSPRGWMAMATCITLVLYECMLLTATDAPLDKAPRDALAVYTPASPPSLEAKQMTVAVASALDPFGSNSRALVAIVSPMVGAIPSEISLQWLLAAVPYLLLAISHVMPALDATFEAKSEVTAEVKSDMISELTWNGLRRRVRGLGLTRRDHSCLWAAFKADRSKRLDWNGFQTQAGSRGLSKQKISQLWAVYKKELRPPTA